MEQTQYPNRRRQGRQTRVRPLTRRCKQYPSGCGREHDPRPHLVFRQNGSSSETDTEESQNLNSRPFVALAAARIFARSNALPRANAPRSIGDGDRLAPDEACTRRTRGARQRRRRNERKRKRKEEEGGGGGVLHSAMVNVVGTEGEGRPRGG